MDKRTRIERLKRLSVLIGLSTLLSFVECCNKSNDKSFKAVISNIKDETCYDEVAGEELLFSVNELEKYVNLSNKLNKLYLDDITCDLTDIKMLSPEEVDILIENYDRNNTVDLCVQNKLINNYIKNYGYDIMAEATLLGLKSRVADISGLDSANVKNIYIMDETAYNKELSKEYRPSLIIGDCNIYSALELRELLVSLYDMQENESYNKKYDNNVTYNRDRNKLIKSAINNLKKVYSNEYKLDNKKRIKKI